PAGGHPGSATAVVLLVLRLLVCRRAADLQLGGREDAVDAATDHTAAGAACGAPARSVGRCGLGSQRALATRPGDRWTDSPGHVRVAGLARFRRSAGCFPSRPAERH